MPPTWIWKQDVLKNLTLGLAGRQEHYDSFGSTTLGKFSARWKIVDALALRGTVSTGFHAPTPGQSNVETLSTTFIPGTATQVQIGTYPVTSSIAKYYGATTLRPEESDNFSAGVVLTPLQNLLLTVDWYDIEVRHRIDSISQQFNVTHGGYYQAQRPGLRRRGRHRAVLHEWIQHQDPGHRRSGHLPVRHRPGSAITDAGL